MRRKTVYAVYDGDNFVDVGTAEELAKRMGYTKNYFSRKAYDFSINGESNGRYVFKLQVEQEEIVYGNWIKGRQHIHYLAKRYDGTLSTLCNREPEVIEYLDDFNLELEEQNSENKICKKCAKEHKMMFL